MRRLAAVLGLTILIAVPARATEWFICSDVEGKASFSVLLGSLGVGTATDFKVEADGKSWSTAPGEGTPIARSQAFENETAFLADVKTEDQAELIAELRLFKANEGEDVVSGGTLRVPGVGAWAVSCSGS